LTYLAYTENGINKMERCMCPIAVLYFAVNRSFFNI